MKWKRARKKPIVVEFREVDGEKEAIETRKGTLFGYKDQDYIIRGIDGEIYPIKQLIFFKTYDVVENDTETEK